VIISKKKNQLLFFELLSVRSAMNLRYSHLCGNDNNLLCQKRGQHCGAEFLQVASSSSSTGHPHPLCPSIAQLFKVWPTLHPGNTCLSVILNANRNVSIVPSSRSILFWNFVTYSITFWRVSLILLLEAGGGICISSIIFFNCRFTNWVVSLLSSLNSMFASCLYLSASHQVLVKKLGVR
jgi:hypothetical protein